MHDGSLIGGEEKAAILAIVNFWQNERASKRSAKLIPLQAIVRFVTVRHCGKMIGSIEVVVANIFKGARMDLICAGLCHDIDYSAGQPPELGAEVIRLDTELLKRIRIRVWIWGVGVVVVIA